jgi:hypothetical protein
MVSTKRNSHLKNITMMMLSKIPVKAAPIKVAIKNIQNDIYNESTNYIIVCAWCFIRNMYFYCCLTCLVSKERKY